VTFIDTIDLKTWGCGQYSKKNTEVTGGRPISVVISLRRVRATISASDCYRGLFQPMLLKREMWHLFAV
jgi:hypothetical protein